MPTSVRAVVNLQSVIESIRLCGQVEILVETIDVACEPLRALKDRIIVTPTLLLPADRNEPPLVGDLSDMETLRAFIERAVERAEKIRPAG